MPVKKNSQSQSVDSASDYAARIRELIEGDRVVQARALGFGSAAGESAR